MSPSTEDDNCSGGVGDESDTGNADDDDDDDVDSS
jgi:hypothetical protein